MTFPFDPRLQNTLVPSSIAVIGATEDPNKVGGRPLHYLLRFGFAGAIYPVNPRRRTIQGLQAFASIAELPTVPDVAIIAVGQDAVPDVIDQCAEHGIGSVIIMSSGFGETGDAGVKRQNALVAQAKRLG